MSIHSMLKENRTHAKVEGASKKRVLQNLAKLFAESIQTMNADELFQCLLQREKLGSTGIGEGIAIPHCRFNTGGETYAACISLLKPIDFDAADGKPVDIIVAMLVPENAEQNHLDTLAELAESMMQVNYVSSLRNATTDAQLYSAITHQ